MTLTLTNLAASFGENELFLIDQLTIPTGSKVGIVGDNGSGKTTLLNLIAGKAPIEQGSISCTETISTIQQLIDTTDTKSGGEQTKERIQQAFYQAYGLLLADEPTNHLDNKGIQYLENQLRHFKGTALIVSHNREFLNRVVDHILEIEQGKVTLYTGNFHDYQRQKEIQEKEQQKKYDHYKKEQKKIKKAIQEVQRQSQTTKKTPSRMGNSESRLHKMGNQRAKKNLDDQADALKTRLSKLEKVEKKREKKQLIIPFHSVQQLHKPIIVEAKHFNMKMEEKVLLKDAEFKLKNKSKTALLGENGTGKTTLFTHLLQKVSAITYAASVKFGYFSQSFNQLDESKTIFENAAETAVHPPQVIRDLLAHMQFRGETIHKKVSVLSGGERSKLAICQLLLSDNNVLLLDEPTNHLDISSIEVLEAALKAYEGTILFISHDETFIKNVATDCWQIANQQIINLEEKERKKAAPAQNEEEILLLENRKIVILSELSSASLAEKEKLEKEFQEIIQKLKLN